MAGIGTACSTVIRTTILPSCRISKVAAYGSGLYFVLPIHANAVVRIFGT
jgi:hypothetical protein